MKLGTVIGVSALLAAAFGATPAAAVVDVIQAPNFVFVPTDAQKEDSPYYRGNGEGWSWAHNAIGGSFVSASLSIAAYDVDFGSGEVNRIEAYDSDTDTWVFLGTLGGSDDTWQFTNFMLGANLFDDINAGLQVRMEIDTNNAGWFVTLSKSALSVPGGRPLPPAVPGVPEPSSWAMLIAGFGLVGAMARRRRPVVAA